MTVFPDDFDSDLEIPRIDSNVSEISGDAINSLRDAVFAIQRVLGLSIQGNKPSLAERLNVSIDANGLIKKSALDDIGLISLPVTNNHIGNNAGIQEVKLDLDYTTSFLFGRVSSLSTDLDGISAGLSAQTSSFNLHILGQSNFHDGYHIKVNLGTSVGIAGLEATTIGDAVNELAQILLSGDGENVSHIDTGIPASVKHLASNIGVNSLSFENISRTANDVQSALNSIDATQGALGVSHVDSFHSNGILKNINSGTIYNSNRRVISSESGVYYTEGTGVMTIPGLSTFDGLDIEPGDILEISSPSETQDIGTYQIRAVGPLSVSGTIGNLPELGDNQIAVFHTFVESTETASNIIINVYKPASISSESAPLACVVRNNEAIVDTVSIMRPNAARVVSIGFNGSIFNSDGYSVGIRIGMDNLETRELVITDLNLERLQTNQADPVDAQSVSERINAFVSDPNLGHHFPVTAYRVGNEIAISHNMVGEDYTLEIVDGYSGNFALGLDAYGANLAGTIQAGNDNNTHSVNGTASSSISNSFDGYGRIDSDSSTFTLYTTSGDAINPLRYGLMGGSVIDVTTHPTNDTNGSYTLFSSNSTGVSLFNPEYIDAPATGTTFLIKASESHVALSDFANAEISQGVVEILIDESGNTQAHQRIIYGTNLGSGVEIIGLSRNFPVGDVTILVSLQSDYIDFNIIDDTIAGNTGKIHENFTGQFKLYHSNNLDYLVIKVVEGSVPGGLDVVTISEPLNSDECMELASVHFDGTLSITHIMDTRQFGNLSYSEARDDFIEIVSQKPVSDLRSNGVARGFDILDIPYFDSVTSMEALPVQGGIAYVNGARVAVETQKVVIQSHDSDGNILNDVRRIVAINDMGSLTSVSDELGELLTDGYSSSVTFGKLLPLYEVMIVNGGISQITDLRLFINNLDDKIELIVDETNNIVGNFRSIEGALMYASKYPSKEKLTIKIVNTVMPTRSLTVPSGVSILGDSPFGGSGKHRILNNTGSLGGEALLILEGDNRIENLSIESSLVSIQAPLISVLGGNVNIEKCSLAYGEDVTSFSSLVAIDVTNTALYDVHIINNKIDNVYTGISSTWGCENLIIQDNIITNLSGTGGVSYGIIISTLTRPVDSISIEGNTIKVPSVVQPSDIRAISVDVREDIEVLRIESNSVIHSVENAMTNGIRVTSEVAGGTGNDVDHLIVSDNYITGIRLDDNGVYGMYLDDIDNASVYRNSILNSGVSGANRSDTAMLLLGSRLNFAEVDNNTFKNGDVQRGIVYNNASGRVNITNNTLYNLGTEAQYIRGTAPWSNISNNTLTGPGKVGIRWSGARSKVANNLMNSVSASDYSFEEHAIFAQTSDIDILNNTITDMIYDGGVGSIFVSNINAASSRVKIVGNTFSGSNVAKFIDLFAGSHIVSDNKFFNLTRNTTVGTLGILLTQVSESLFNGNLFTGELSSAFHSGATSVSNLTITNNSVNVTLLSTASITFAATATNDCLIIGNRFPEGDPDDVARVNIIGATPSFSVTNDNVIGINWGMQDVLSLPAASAVPGFETESGADHAGVPHWAMKALLQYWEINRSVATDERLLYFPIASIPNGAKLNSVSVQGRTITGDTAMEARVYKRSVNAAGLTLTPISAAVTLPTASSGNDFTNSNPGSVVAVTEVGGEIVNYEENSYFVQVKQTQASPTNPTEIRVYGVTVRFTY